MEKGRTQTDEVAGAVVERSAELQVGSESSAKEQEIKAMVVIAKRFPRDEEASFRALLKSADRPEFAEEAAYSFPRGDKTVTGPSIVLAREAGRLWGNIKSGIAIIRDDEDTRLIRGYAWDMQTNAYAEFEDDFRKIIFRKGKGWIVPDERDLRELTNRRGAILVRNCILSVLPKDRIDGVLARCAQTLKGQAKSDLPASRKKALAAFAELGITQVMIEQKLGHGFGESTADELAELRGIYESIKDGQSKWAEYVAGPGDEEQDAVDASRLKDAQAAVAAGPAISVEDGLIDDARWGRIVEYLDADPQRQGVKKAVKAKMKIDRLDTVEPHQRIHFVNTICDSAKKARVAIQVPA